MSMPVERLVAARCADPFSHLGLLANPDGPGLKLTAWLPDAQEVRVRIKSGKIVATLTAHRRFGPL
jgi:1,4-alpha-glucan branching enzyme